MGRQAGYCMLPYRLACLVALRLQTSTRHELTVPSDRSRPRRFDMGKQTNKLKKRTRRKRYLERKKARAKLAMKR